MLSLDPLLTERLEIRPFQMADKDAAYAFSSDPVARQYAGGAALSREESDAGLERQLESVEQTGLGAPSSSRAANASWDIAAFSSSPRPPTSSSSTAMRSPT